MNKQFWIVVIIIAVVVGGTIGVAEYDKQFVKPQREKDFCSNLGMDLFYEGDSTFCYDKTNNKLHKIIYIGGEMRMIKEYEVIE